MYLHIIIVSNCYYFMYLELLNKINKNDNCCLHINYSVTVYSVYYAYMLILRAFRSANWSTMSLKLINSNGNVVFSTERIARSVRRSCVIADRR